MNTFAYHNPTRLFFGKGSLGNLATQIPSGSKVLLVYGGGSIKKNGLYDQVIEQLHNLQANVFELSGVEPNPRLSTVNKGAELCKKEGITFILAVGGGSVIDCVKAIAAAAKLDGDMWDVITRKRTVEDALPFGTVLTLAATGSEMNSGSVITNWETKEKYGWGSPLVFPKFSILDPTFTFTVPRDQTIYGMVDIMSHVFEQYFNHTGNSLVQDGFCETILRTVIATAPKLLANLEDYPSRETILYSGTMALNGTLAMGIQGDWATHNIEHAVSAVYDIPHGGGLAILFPNWMEHVLDEGVDRFKQMAINVFGIDPAGKTDRDVALEGIRALRTFWTSIGAPSRLADYGIGEENLELMADKAMVYGPFGHFKVLNREDVLAIYRKSL
ncbi:iron-containing alcohol dehydrogenase [Brevibacillus fluminis]|uniref:iron-containing alcohol dehydrogenase n=1 Tax=Brevibacillus fluminis TaxID=511487 RepID=UPI003F8A7BFE